MRDKLAEVSWTSRKVTEVLGSAFSLLISVPSLLFTIVLKSYELFGGPLEFQGFLMKKN